MYNYKILPTNKRSLPLQVDPETFSSEWRACWQDKDRDMTTLMEYATPMISHWRKLLQRTTLPDINFVSLCAQLSPEPAVALHKVDKWLRWATHSSSIEDELRLIFITHVREANYYPKFANYAMAEYIIAKDFRYRLKDFIKKAHIQNMDYILFDTSKYEIAVEPDYPDYFLLKHLHLNKWESYLFEWMSNGRSSADFTRASHIPFDTFKHEERQLWRLLKENYSNPVESPISKPS